MSSIFAAGGLSSGPGISAAGGKEGDGTGNGSGGMYFGSAPEEPYPSWPSSYGYGPSAELRDIPFILLAFGYQKSNAFRKRKKLLANLFYETWEPVPWEQSEPYQEP